MEHARRQTSCTPADTSFPASRRTRSTSISMPLSWRLLCPPARWGKSLTLKAEASPISRAVLAIGSSNKPSVKRSAKARKPDRALSITLPAASLKSFHSDERGGWSRGSSRESRPSWSVLPRRHPPRLTLPPSGANK